jgi:CRP-like cAMP-binding protein
MSRSDIADFLNLTLETVSRTCRQLSDTGILAFSPRQVRIVDRPRFEKLVTSG